MRACGCLFLLLLYVENLNGAKILGIVPMTMPSHFILGSKLMKALASKGHEVTIITAFPEINNIENYTEIVLENKINYHNHKKDMETNYFDLTLQNPFVQMTHISYGCRVATEMVIQDAKVQELLKSDRKFDLVISAYVLNEVNVGFAHKFDCPFVLLSTVDKKDGEANFFDLALQNPFVQLIPVSIGCSFAAEMVVQDAKVQELLKSDRKFDLVISVNVLNEVNVGFAHKFDCPFVLLSTVGTNAWLNNLVLNPSPYSYVPDLMLNYASRMSFWQRLVNTYYGLYFEAFRSFYQIPKQDELLKKYFNDTPPLMELMDKRLSMILLNSHPVINDPKPLLPSMVEIGGFHVDEPKALPKDLQEFMDSADDGVILFSMGSNLKSAQLPVEKREAILKTFAKLKQKVVWKWETDSLPGQPGNVKIYKWLPQNDIMGHPNLRAFITHGGLLSTIEAVYHGVPIVGIPIFGDQKMNIAQAIIKKFAVAVNYDELTEERLTSAVNEILHNLMYRENVQRSSRILRDQPARPIDSAVFWIEYVMRNRGAEHFKTSARFLHWSQLYLLDVIGITVGMTLLIVSVICIVRKKNNMKLKKS